ncbi:MAG: hypothetical protein LBO21_00470, partial [Synergistaceae bacterium]|nr:hypothetical protein [Synergistaceae bacterium]
MIVRERFGFVFPALASAAIILVIGLAAAPAYSRPAARGENDWAWETGKILSLMAVASEGAEHEIDAGRIISLGAPAYNHLVDRVSEESSYALTFFADGMPRIIVGELSKVVPFGGVTLEFDDFRSSDYAKEMLIEASGFLPTRWLEWIVRLNRGRKLTA